jgi:hypothetical protein
MHNKKAIELSVNFIVMLILGLSVFGFGISLLYNLFEEANKQQDQLDQQTQDRIMKLLDDGSLVSIPFNDKTIPRDGKDVFGVGILNTFDTQSSSTFYMLAQCYRPGSQQPEQDIGLLYEADHEIANNEKKIVKIQAVVDKDTESGTYICNICVSRNREEIRTMNCHSQAGIKDYLYDQSLQKMYINVP